MTILNAYFQPDGVLISMDTLASWPETMRPRHFTTKMWFIDVNERMVVRDIAQLDRCAPTALRELAASLDLATLGTATVYHFGYSPDSAQFKGYAYRSTNTFTSEPLPYGLIFKPPVQVEQSAGEEINEFFARVAKQQRAEDDALPLEQKVGIGGDVLLLALTPTRMSIERCYRFDDYKAQYEDMCAQL